MSWLRSQEKPTLDNIFGIYQKKILIFLDVKFFITDTVGRPIENAELEQNELELNGTSDSNGKITLNNLCYGTMLNSFVISSAGFCDYTGSNYVINKIPQLLIPVELKANSGTYLPSYIRTYVQD